MKRLFTIIDLDIHKRLHLPLNRHTVKTSRLSNFFCASLEYLKHFNMFRRRANSAMPVTSTPKPRRATILEESQVTVLKSLGLQPSNPMKHTRSQSVCVDSLVRYDKRTRKPPVRFNAEDFENPKPSNGEAFTVKKTRRVSIAAASKARRASVSAPPKVIKVVTKTRKSSQSLENGSNENIIEKIEEIARCSVRKLPKKSPIRTPLYVKATFPANVNATRDRDMATMMKFDNQSGILHLNPKAKLPKRRVNAECDFVSFIVMESVN